MPDELAVQQDRRGFLGGSDLAAVLGISPWKTPYELWEEKLGIAPESEDSEQRTKVLNRGKRLEPIVMEMLQDEYDIAVANRNAVYFDSEHPWMRAEIDFEYQLLDGSIGNGDVKTIHPYAAKDWGETLTDEVPTYYIAQFQWGMMITGTQVCAVAALIGADDLRLYYVRRDEDIIAMLREKALAFWNSHVLAEMPPPAMSKGDAARILSKFEGLTIQTTDDITEALRRLRGIKNALKRLQGIEAKYELDIQLRMSVAWDGAVTPDRFAVVDTDGHALVTWNLTRRAGYEVKVKPTQYRTMRIKNVKAKR